MPAISLLLARSNSLFGTASAQDGVVESDLEIAFRLSDAADSETLRWWSSAGVASSLKNDGSPVTDADSAAERAMLDLVREVRPGDGLLGEEIGEHLGNTSVRMYS